MSLSIYFQDEDDSDGPFQLASASGWQAVSDWVKTIPKASFPTLHELVREGEVLGTNVLSEELKDALRYSSPTDQNVVDTLEQFQDVLGMGRETETATVTNG